MGDDVELAAPPSLGMKLLMRMRETMTTARILMIPMILGTHEGSPTSFANLAISLYLEDFSRKVIIMSSAVVIMLMLVAVLVIAAVGVGIYLWLQRRRAAGGGTTGGTLTLRGSSGSLFTFTLPAVIPTPPSTLTYVVFSIGSETTPETPQYIVGGGTFTVTPTPTSPVRMTKVGSSVITTLTPTAGGVYSVPSS